MKYTLLYIFIFVIAGCSSKSDKDYMDEASENVKKNEISEAITGYQNLVKEYPESKLAPEALYQVATLYQNKMVKNLSERESLENSAKVFREIHDKYPDFNRTPYALFMSAYILANELQRYEEATEAYKLFLKKYPDHEWSFSAKSEIENMGLPPEEILQKKQKLSSDG